MGFHGDDSIACGLSVSDETYLDLMKTRMDVENLRDFEHTETRNCHNESRAITDGLSVRDDNEVDLDLMNLRMDIESLYEGISEHRPCIFFGNNSCMQAIRPKPKPKLKSVREAVATSLALVMENESYTTMEEASTNPLEDHHKEIEDLMENAFQLTKIGLEDLALKKYDRALDLSRQTIRWMTEQLRGPFSPFQGKESDEPAKLEVYWDCCDAAMKVANIKTSMSIIYERNGNYDRAIASCKEAQRLYGQQVRNGKFLDRNRRRISNELNRNVIHMLKLMETARDSLPLRNRLHGDISTINQEIAKIKASTNDIPSKVALYYRGMRLLSEVFKIESKTLGDSHPILANTLSGMAHLSCEAQIYQQALEFADAAFLVAQASLGKSHPITGEKLRQKGKIYELLGESDEALKCYKTATNIFERSQPQFHSLDNGEFC